MSSPTIQIRRAVSTDLDWLVEQLRAFSTFFGSQKKLFDDEQFARAGMLNMMNEHMVMIAEREDVVQMGFIAGVVTPHLFNPQIRVLSETFWWVPEEHRGSRAGLLLLESFMAWGKAHSDWILFALEEKSPVNERVLLKRGFHLQERSYLMEVH